MQAIRAVAAFMVIFVHLDFLLSGIGLPQFGYGGVDLFFVISGFIMCITTGSRKPSPGEFMTNRIVRVVPIYWLLTIFMYCIARFRPGLLQSPDTSLPSLLKSLFFIPFMHPNGRIEPNLFVGWTLNYEMFFYVLFAGCLFLRDRRIGIAVILTILAGLCLAGMTPHTDRVLVEFYTSPFIIEFGFGILVGCAYPHIPMQGSRRMIAGIELAVLSCLVLIICAPFIAPGVPSAITCGLPASFIVLGAIALEKWRVVVTSSLMLGLGNASYSMYLTHPFVTQVFQKVGTHYHATGIVSAALIVGALISVCLIGYAFHVMVEKPLTSLARRLTRAPHLKVDKASAV